MAFVRYFDTSLTGVHKQKIVRDQITFSSISNTAIADEVILNKATFLNKSLLTPPAGITLNSSYFTVYVNGVLALPQHYTVTESNLNVHVNFNSGLLGYDVEPTDQVILTGKFT